MLPEGHADVLVIGAGPAGLMCANALALAGVNVRIIDIRPKGVAAGQADGITSRTIEVLQSYGLGRRLLQEGNHIHMSAFYGSAPDGKFEVSKAYLGFLNAKKGALKCTGRDPLVTTSPARYPFMITLQQGAIESIFLDSLKDHGIEVERPKKPSILKISEDADELSSLSSYPVKVTVENLEAIDDEKTTEIIHAKYVVGTDGAHSWVRKALGIEMEGEQTDYVWGVVDMRLETDFPDIRNVTMVHSEVGSCLIVPREADKNRFYILLSDTDIVDPLTGRIDKSRMNPQKILSMSRKIVHPYRLADPENIDWWTVYTIGQRVASSYSVKNRIFIAGDACHTHSPKAGQGMNASMNDTHNLAWKLVQTLRGWSRPSLLETYEFERRKFAQDLIDFDKQYAALFSGKPRQAKNEGDESHETLSRALRVHEGFVTGLGIQYSPSLIVETKHQKIAENLVVGQRMLPQIFVRAADVHPIEIHDMLPADARFKVLFFVGSPTCARITELKLLAETLNQESSFLHKYSTNGDISTVFEIITILAGKKGHVNHLHVPEFFRPHWRKVLLDDTDVTEQRGGHAYERFGINPEQITLVVVRPDGYVGTIAPSTAIADLEDYFGSFMVGRSANL